MKNQTSKQKTFHHANFVFAFLILLGSFLFYTHSAHAATYYIDYSSGSDANTGLTKSSPWQHQPYMKGFTGTYTHQAGDVFIFKGGVTWAYSATDPIFPIEIQQGGASGNPDQYTVDKTWYDGSSYTPPIFDGCQTAEGLNVCGLNGAATLGANSWLIGDDNGVYSVSNVIINGLQLQDVGDPILGGGDGSGDDIQLLGGGSAVEIKNNILIPHAISAFSISNTGNTKNASAIYIHDNQISYAGRGTIYGNIGYIVNDVQIYRNKWQGPGLTLADDLYGTGYHNDGLMIGCASGCSGTSPTVTNISFHNNMFYGQWDHCTAQYYSNGYTENTSIYNNVFSIENNTANGAAMQYFVQMNYDATATDWGTINLYNNTFSTDSLLGTNGVQHAFTFTYPSNANNPLTINIKNNIYSGMLLGNIIGSGTWNALNVDNNLYNLTKDSSGGYGDFDYINGTQYASLSSACAAGYDCNSLGGNTYSSSYPGFVSLPNGTVGSGNWHLQSSSPAIGAATNLSSSFTTDLDGIARPATGAWDIGAYQYAADTTPPTVTAFTLPSTATSLTVSVSSFAATDNTGVTGYCLSETNSASGCSWTSTAPTTYVFSSSGSHTLYAFSKDAAGNISSSASASITITLACTSFTYSSWGSCQSNNTQTRTVTGSTPSSCEGGTPVTSESCTYVQGSIAIPAGGGGGVPNPLPTPEQSVITPAPSRLAASPASDGEISLYWSPSANAEGYKVYRNGSLVATTDNTYWSDASLAPGTRYAYAVSAFNEGGYESPRSESASATTTSAQASSPATSVPQMPPTIPSHASSLTSSQAQAILNLLSSFGADLSTVANVRTILLGGQPASSASTAPSFSFTENLSLYDTGPDVTELQRYLNENGYSISSQGPGSPGNETSLFGLSTYKALIRFQEAHGLPATGYFGPMTRGVVGE